MLALSAHAGGQEKESLAKEQAKEVENLMVSLQKKFKESQDDIVAAPQKAIEAGCLDNIFSVDLSVFAIDPANLWDQVYKEIKDQIINLACSATESYINEHTKKLEAKLEAPYGLGSIGVGQGGSIRDWDDIQNASVDLSNEEARERVSEGVFGTRPANRRVQSVGDNILPNLAQPDPGARDRTKENEEKVKKILNFKSLWSDDGSKEGGKDEKN